ncbi:hypothetical protein ACIA5D_23430 [Actinoplanes sp. NPDC051513]|uniref:hypothetical protein n=1 Tax=Actinoplanes sp. NPDC051513 TaxID=3363908 RepID=UPI0037A164EB
MTVTTAMPVQTGKDPQSLVDPETFDKLARFFAARQEVSQHYAERALGQFLIFLKAHADGLRNDPAFGMLLPTGESYRVVPTAPIDAVWHACLQNTEPYAAACDAIAGDFVHHRPILTEAMQNGTAKQYTMKALAETGYAIDMEFWDGEAESCCPPNPGV